MLMHSEKSQMMDRYTIGGVAPRLKLAVGAFDAAVWRGSLEQTAGSNGWQQIEKDAKQA